MACTAGRISLFGIIRGAVERGTKKIRLHILTDGRDVPDGSSLKFIEELEAVLKEVSPSCDAKIASGGGRMHVTMDRYEADWNIVKRGWDAHVLGVAPHTFEDAHTAVKTLRKDDSDKPVSDQWLEAFVNRRQCRCPRSARSRMGTRSSSSTSGRIGSSS